MVLSAAFATTPGNTYSENQDAILVDGVVHQGKHTGEIMIDAPRALLAVADGLAVSPCAARASRTALGLLAAAYRMGAPLSDVSLKTVRAGMIAAAGRHCRGMACTIAAVSLHAAGATIVHAGDCRVYLHRDGSLDALTEDHTVLRRMIRDGMVDPAQAAELGAAYLDPDSALIADPYEDEFEVGVRELALRDGDVLILASDGLSALLSDAGAGPLIRRGLDATLGELARSLVAAAVGESANDDNASVIVARYGLGQASAGLTS